MIEFNIQNCNNINSGTFVLKKNHLNIRYAMNGTGKSTIAEAINCISTNTDIYNKKDISDLTPFGSDLTPTCQPSETINNCMLFNEAFVDEIVFQQSEVIQNSFEVFIKTPEYEAKQQKINERLDKIHIAISQNEDLRNLVTVGNVVLSKFQITSTGALRRSGNLKSLLETDSIITFPDALKAFQPMIDKDYKLEWVGWKNEGSNYDDNNICPFCTVPLKESYEQEKTIFNTSYKKSNVKNILDTLSYFRSVEEYMNEEKKERLYQCIKRPADEKEILFMIKKFHSELEYLVRCISSVERFNSYQVRSENISKLGEQLETLIIDPSILDIFNNKKVIELIEFINSRIQAVKKETNLLKTDIGQLESMIGSSKKAAVNNINNFLSTAGINYKFEIIDEGENKSRTILRYISRTGEPVDVDVIKDHLSWGERNAFALVLFMHYALSLNPDIIILDDPISSFDSNKKYAIINHLFTGQKSFYNKTVLMLTHDMQPLIDILVVNKPIREYVSVYFMQNKDGVTTEQEIKEKDIKPLPTLLTENSKNESLNIVHRMACLRKLIDTLPKDADPIINAYHLLSSIFHIREKPTLGDNTTKLTKNQVESGEEFIRQYIADFNYTDYYKQFLNKEYLFKCFNSENNPYICLQLFRILMRLLDLKVKISDNPLIKYIDEQLHIENDYLFSLDFMKYDIVPDFVIPRCSKFLEDECKDA
ncbi:AAA family ATPase [Chloroflexota bacterium]